MTIKNRQDIPKHHRVHNLYAIVVHHKKENIETLATIPDETGKQIPLFASSDQGLAQLFLMSQAIAHTTPGTTAKIFRFERIANITAQAKKLFNKSVKKKK